MCRMNGILHHFKENLIISDTYMVDIHVLSNNL